MQLLSSFDRRRPRTDDAAVLEVAPGPGYFAVELAKLGRFHVTGLDVSRTFVERTIGFARERAPGGAWLARDQALGAELAGGFRERDVGRR